MKNAKRIMEFVDELAIAAYNHGYDQAHAHLDEAGIARIAGARPNYRKRIRSMRRRAVMQALGLAEKSRVPQVYIDAFKEKRT